MVTFRLVQAFVAVLALADLSQASTAAKGIPNVKKAVTDFKKVGGPAFVKKSAEMTKPTTKVSKTTAVRFGMLLASTAGIMNGACLSGLVSGAGQATTAVTGALTSAATGFGAGNSAKSIGAAKCILSYIGGSAIAGVLTPKPAAFDLKDAGSMAFSFVAAAASLIIATMKIKAGDKSFIFFSLAAAGIQNSVTSTFTSNLCRTAHFSGTTSDIGTLIGQALRGNFDSLPKLKVLSLLFLSFWAGAFVSQPLGKAYEANTLLIAAGIYLGVAGAIALSPKSRAKLA